MLPHVYQGVFGFCDFEDVYREMVASAPPEAVLVELGVYLGRSACFLAVEAQNAGRRLQTVHVDSFPVMPGWMPCWHEGKAVSADGTLYAEARRNLERTGARCWSLMKADQVEAAGRFADGACWSVYLDTDHEYGTSLEALRAWWPRVAPGGWFGGHDYGHPQWPGLRQAVDGWAWAAGVPVGVQGTSWVVRKGLQTAGGAAHGGRDGEALHSVPLAALRQRQFEEAMGRYEGAGNGTAGAGTTAGPVGVRGTEQKARAGGVRTGYRMVSAAGVVMMVLAGVLLLCGCSGFGGTRAIGGKVTGFGCSVEFNSSVDGTYVEAEVGAGELLAIGAVLNPDGTWAFTASDGKTYSGSLVALSPGADKGYEVATLVDARGGPGGATVTRLRCKGEVLAALYAAPVLKKREASAAWPLCTDAVAMAALNYRLPFVQRLDGRNTSRWGAWNC